MMNSNKFQKKIMVSQILVNEKNLKTAKFNNIIQAIQIISSQSKTYYFLLYLSRYLKTQKRMFSTIMERVMLQFLGDYIDGIKNSMDVALLKGKIKIENVSLKKDFFDNLSLPLRLGYSRVQSIHVHVPWTHLKEKPTTVEVDGIYALFYVNYEMEEYKFDAQARFREMIEKATEMIEMKFQQKQREPGSIVEKYILRIIDNIKIKVRNIHIRLQSIQRNWDFSTGLLIKKISIFTSNQNGQKHFFTRTKKHHHIFKSHKGEEQLYKKIQVNNIDIYFNQTQTQFLTHVQNKQIVLSRMKDFLHSEKSSIEQLQNRFYIPHRVLSLSVNAMIKAKLNEHNRYDIDTTAKLLPITFNLSDRMTSQLLYFIQFAFQWQMRKYKKPNKESHLTPEMIKFYKIMLNSVIEDIPVHKADYKSLMQLLGQWDWEFLNAKTLEYVQERRLSKELGRRRNRKLAEDPQMREQLRKEIEERILTEDQAKEIYDIVGNIHVNLQVPYVAVNLIKSGGGIGLLAEKSQQILSIGLRSINISFHTLPQQSTALTLTIDDFLFKTGKDAQKINILTLPPSNQPFLTIIFTRSQQQHVQSCSIKLSKREILVSQYLVSDMIQWSSAIKLRPATVYYIKEILFHYTTEIIKKLLEILFKEFRVISLSLGLPRVAVVMREKENFVVDLGKVEGRNVTDQEYRLEFVEDVRVEVGGKGVVTVEKGVKLEITDKMKAKEGFIYHINDRKKISVIINCIKLNNLHNLIQFTQSLALSPLITQFLSLSIIQEQSLLLQGTFHLNTLPRRQRIILKGSKLHFLPSHYVISLRGTKIYQMRSASRFYLIFHQITSSKVDMVEVDSEIHMETIFYRLRELVHEIATATQWDLFYKQEYPVEIDKLETLKSQQGENMAMFNVSFQLRSLIVPLNSYIEGSQQRTSQPPQLKSTDLLAFLDTNDQTYLNLKKSFFSVQNLSLHLNCYQLSTDLFSKIGNIRLVIQNYPLVKNLSLELVCSKEEFLLVKVNVKAFEVVVLGKEVVERVGEVIGFFEQRMERLFNVIQQSRLMQRVQMINRQKQQLSILQSSSTLHNISQQQSHYVIPQQHLSFPSHTKTFLLSCRLLVDLSHFKMNMLNYISQVKDLTLETSFYRTEYFPSFDLAINEAIVMSAVQVIGVRVKLEQDRVASQRYNLGVVMEKMATFVDLGLVVMDVAAGEVGALVVEVLSRVRGKVEKRSRRNDRRERQQNTRSQRKQLFGKGSQQFSVSSCQQSTFHQPQPQLTTRAIQPPRQHFPFQQFISPIKARQPSSSHQFLPSQQSLTSLTSQLLHQSPQTYFLVLDCTIRNIQAEVTVSASMAPMIVKINRVRIEENLVRVEQVRIEQQKRSLVKCREIGMVLPVTKVEHVNDISLQLNVQGQVRQEQLFNIQHKPLLFQSPIKSTQTQHHIIFSPQSLLSQQPTYNLRPTPQTIQQQRTQIKLQELQINIQMKLLTELTVWGIQISKRLHQSDRLMKIKREVLQLVRVGLRNRGKIERVIEQGKQKLQQLSQPGTQYQIAPYIDLRHLLDCMYVSLSHPIPITIFSSQEKQLFTLQVNLNLFYPTLQQSFFTFTMNHFNSLIQLYEPVMQPTRIRLQRQKIRGDDEQQDKLGSTQMIMATVQEVKLVMSEEMVRDLVKDLGNVKQTISGVKQIESKQMTVNDVEYNKLKMYDKFREFSLIEETLVDLQYKQQHIIQRQYDILAKEKQLLDEIVNMGNFSKLTIRNLTHLQVMLTLEQSSYPLQHLTLYSRQQQSQLTRLETQLDYLIIPHAKTQTDYSKAAAHEFLERDMPLKIKIGFSEDTKRYQFMGRMEVEFLVNEVSGEGQMRFVREVEYQDVDGEGDILRTMVEVVVGFDEERRDLVMSINPQYQLINKTILQLLISPVNLSNQSYISPNTKPIPIPQHSRSYLPFYMQQQLSLSLVKYQQRDPNRLYTLSLPSELSLQQNYPKENFLVTKEEFVHYFQVKLGKEYCFVPLLIVKVKKFEKVWSEKLGCNVFNEIKGKIIVMPLVRVQNHLARSVFINGQQYRSSSTQSAQQQHQNCIYFFLSTQYKTSLESILLSFTSSGEQYHLDLPQNLYLPKPLSFPSFEHKFPIVLNMMTCKNQMGQMILHVYPMIQLMMHVPLKEMHCQMLCKVKDQEKKFQLCQGMRESYATLDNLTETSIEEYLFYLPEENQRVKLHLSASQSISSQQQQTISKYFTSTIPTKKDLGYVDLLSSQFISSSQSSSSSDSASSSSQSIAVSEQEEGRVDSRIVFIPSFVTRNGQKQMVFGRYQVKRRKVKFCIEEELSAVITAKDSGELLAKVKQKYEYFYAFELRPVAQAITTDVRLQGVKKEIVEQVAKIQKVKKLKKVIKQKLAAHQLSLLVEHLNVSVIVRKSQSSRQVQQVFSTRRRSELVNIDVTDLCLNLRLLLNSENRVSEVQLEQKVGGMAVNAIECQKMFSDSILKLNQGTEMVALMGLTLDSDNESSRSQKSSEPENNQLADVQQTFSLPTLKLSKLFINFIAKQPQTQQDYHFSLKLTDTFIFECFSYAIELYPLIKPLLKSSKQSILTKALQTESIAGILESFEGLMLVQEATIKMSFISLPQGKVKGEKNRRIQKRIDDRACEEFVAGLAGGNAIMGETTAQNKAYEESQTMQAILKYIKKIPFNVLQVQKAKIIIPEIGINGRMTYQEAIRFQTDLMVGFATGFIKGMKIIGSPSSLMEYVQKNKKFRKKQKLYSLMDRIAKGSLNSFTGILKAFSNGVSKLTFDQTYQEERQQTIVKQPFARKSQQQSSSTQGIQSLFLGIKSGFTGLIERPVQNFQEQGTEGLIKGSIKGVAGLFTKPLTGILDLGAKTLQSFAGQKRSTEEYRYEFMRALITTYCRPLFYQCSMIKPFTSTQHLGYVLLKTLLKRTQRLSLLCCFMLKQNSFMTQEQKQNQNIPELGQTFTQHSEERQNMKHLLAICMERSYFISFGKNRGDRLDYSRLQHRLIKAVGREDAGVCLLVRKGSQEDDEREINEKDEEVFEVSVLPQIKSEQEQIYLIYKKLSKLSV